LCTASLTTWVPVLPQLSVKGRLQCASQAARFHSTPLAARTIYVVVESGSKFRVTQQSKPSLQKPPGMNAPAIEQRRTIPARMQLRSRSAAR
jgi:hypothetical protein